METPKRVNQQLEKIIGRIIQAGFQIDARALQLLRELSPLGTVEEVVERTLAEAESLSQKPLFLTYELLQRQNSATENIPETLSTPLSPSPYAQQIDAKLEIIHAPSEAESSSGDMEDLLAYFKDRFTRLSEILRERSDVRDSVPLGKALNAPTKQKMKAIVFVSEKRERKGTMQVEVEDANDHATLVVSGNTNKATFEKAQRLFLDQVVCVEMLKARNDLLIANDFINPDIPEKPHGVGEDEVYAVLTSDLHVGSDKFLPDVFNRFLSWLRGKADGPEQRRIAGRVKYVIIAGDLVDGIGVYPNQEKELEIKDIQEQYSAVGKLLSAIPDYIEILLVPGNHDASRQALPQPCIPEKFIACVQRYRKVVNLPNPSRVRVHGIEVLIYHGTSLNDVVGTIPEVTYQRLSETLPIAMRSLLKARHLAPQYGGRTPILARKRDELVIDVPPDILHCGHVHVTSHEMYRGTLLVNSGAWQAQTTYQERMGLNPTPGIVPVVNLKDLSLLRLNFA